MSTRRTKTAKNKVAVNGRLLEELTVKKGLKANPFFLNIVQGVTSKEISIKAGTDDRSSKDIEGTLKLFERRTREYGGSIN